MTKPYSFLKWMFTTFVLFLALTSCNKGLKDDVSDLKDRVTTLEESVNLLDQAIKNGKLITDVSPVEASETTPGGWLVTFSDKSTIAINNGATGAQSKAPYIWINNAGNWAAQIGSKPVAPDSPSYELKVGGQSVKASGVAVRVINKDGYIVLKETNETTNTTSTVATGLPYDTNMAVAAIVETGESVLLSVGGKEYLLAKAPVYPTSITVIRDKDYVIKGGTVEFEIAVNPANSKVYTKEDFELDFEKHYTRAYGITPDFVKIQDVQPNPEIKGQYKMTLAWSESNEGFVKDAAIFIVLNYTDVEGNTSQVISSTPVIMNEKYVSIKAENVLALKDIVMFSDETFTDSVRLGSYHQGYVNTVDHALQANPSGPIAINPLTRYLTPDGDKYKFTVVPFGADNATVWPAGVLTRYVDVETSVTDYGRQAVPEVPAKPEIGQPAVPAIPGIPAVTIKKGFKVTVYKVAADNVILEKDFQDRWLPNMTTNYTLDQTLNTTFTDNGYKTDDWNFAIKTQDLQVLKTEWASTPMDKKVAPDVSKFDAANGYAVSYLLLPTIDPGKYQVVLTITATPKTARPAELKQTREFKVKLLVNVVAPKFQIHYNDNHTLIGSGSDTYRPNNLKDVNVTFLFDVNSNRNISKPTDVTPNATPLAYDYVTTSPLQGSQGVQFDPYPAVKAPLVADWSTSTVIRKSISAYVKLATGQSIPISILCKEDETQHSISVLYVEYVRLNLVAVTAQTSDFAGNYSDLARTSINIAANSNFTPVATGNAPLDPTMIQSIKYTAEGPVRSTTLPNGLEGKQVMKIDAATGMVSAIEGVSWEDEQAVLYQVFRVTYTDIWGNSAYTEVKVHVKSNSIPTII